MRFYQSRRRLHSSYLIAVGCAAIVVGVWSAQLLPSNNFGSLVWFLSSATLIIFGVVVRYIYASVFLIIVGGLLFGIWYSTPYLIDNQKVSRLIGETVEAIGTISEDPKYEAGGSLTFKLDRLDINGKPISGSLWVEANQTTKQLRRSDMVLVRGKLRPGFSGYVAAVTSASILDYQETSKSDNGLNVRDYFSDRIKTTMSEPESSLGLGFLLGQQNGLPVDLLESLQIVGLTHLIVASGYNLTILVRLARKLFEKVSKYLSAVASLVMIISFVTITGWSPSMTRAGLVAAISLAAWYYGRKIHPMVLLPLVAAITVFIKPNYVWGDLGWTLSFAAFGGILILAPYLRAYFFGDKNDNFVIRVIIETSSAYLMTVPLIALTMGKLSLVAIFANLLVVPLISIVMLLVFVAGFAAIFSIWLGQIIGWFGYVVIHYIIWVSSYLASFSWASVEIKLNIVGLLCWYIAVVGLCLYLRKVTKIKLIETNIVV